MRLDHDQLVFKALVALDQAVEDCHEAPLQPTFALRFVLAWLYAVSTENAERRHYDEFWRHLQDPGRDGAAEWEKKYIRSTEARGSLWGIARNAGVPTEVKLWHRISAAHREQKRRKQATSEPS